VRHWIIIYVKDDNGTKGYILNQCIVLENYANLKILTPGVHKYIKIISKGSHNAL
jgi:hypothetical protein